VSSASLTSSIYDPTARQKTGFQVHAMQVNVRYSYTSHNGISGSGSTVRYS